MSTEQRRGPRHSKWASWQQIQSESTKVQELAEVSSTSTKMKSTPRVFVEIIEEPITSTESVKSTTTPIESFNDLPVTEVDTVIVKKASKKKAEE